MSKPTPDQFHLKKVKLLTNGGIDLKWEVREAASTESHEALETKRSTKDPHGDLTSIVRETRPWLAKVLSFNTITAMVEHPDFKAEKKQKDAAKNAFNAVLDKIKVSEVEISGTLENRGISIKGTMKIDTKQHIPLKTHKLKFDGKAFGFESDMQEVIDRLEEECYKYLYEGKVAQLELAFSEQQQAEKEIDEMVKQIS